MNNRGILIYKENRPKSKKILNIILQIMLLFCIIIIGGFGLIYPFGYNYSNGLVHVILFESMLGIAFAACTSYYYFELMEFPFDIYENGFTYRKRLKGADKYHNYMQYEDIIGVEFINYGLVCVIVTKKGLRIKVKIQPEYDSYIILTKMLIKRFNLIKYPNFDEIIMYMKSGDYNKVVSNNFDQLMKINKEFE